MRAIYTLENVLYRLGDRHAALSEEEMATFEIRSGLNVLNGLSERRAKRSPARPTEVFAATQAVSRLKSPRRGP